MPITTVIDSARFLTKGSLEHAWCAHLPCFLPLHRRTDVRKGLGVGSLSR